MTSTTDNTLVENSVKQHEEDKADETEPEIHFEPVIKLEKVEVSSMEEEEIPLYKMRAKLFRYDAVEAQWKERGIGDIRMMMHKTSGKVRLLMRREKTLKICVNHYITPDMRLQPNAYSDRALSWNATADFSEGEIRSEVLAIRFKDAATSQRFNLRFEEMRCWNEALANGSMQPNNPSCPKAEENAADGPAEAGSEKKKKEDAATIPCETEITSCEAVKVELDSETNIDVPPTSFVDMALQEKPNCDLLSESASSCQDSSDTKVIYQIDPKASSDVVENTLEPVSSQKEETIEPLGGKTDDIA